MPIKDQITQTNISYINLEIALPQTKSMYSSKILGLHLVILCMSTVSNATERTGASVHLDYFGESFLIFLEFY